MVLAAGCESTGGKAVASFELTIRPVLAPSQSDLFDEVNILLLRIRSPSGEVVEYELDAERGTSPAIEDLASLEEDSVFELEGHAGSTTAGEPVAWGTSAPTTVGRKDELELDIFMASTGEMATFYELDAGSWGAALASDGQGNFYIFGGSDSDILGVATDEIKLWSLVPPADDFPFVTTSGFPTTHDDWGADGVNEITGRAHASATLLAEGGHSDVGKILVAGGWESFQDSPTVTSQIFLYDPLAEPDAAVTEVAELSTGRAAHTAIGVSSGDVVFFGGYNFADPGYISCPTTVEVYMATTDETTYGSERLDHCLLDGAGSPLGDDAFYCGGISWGATTFGAYSDCTRVDRFGNVSVVDGPDLGDDVGLMLPAMAALSGDRALLTGGIQVEDTVSDSTWVEATNSTWLYNADSDTWIAGADMKVARAGHAATALPDGRVLVVGGASEVSNSGFSFSDPIACAEIYDPDTGTWLLLDPSCTSDSSVGSLPAGMFRPGLVADPHYGVLVYGALEQSWDASPHFALYVPD